MAVALAPRALAEIEFQIARAARDGRHGLDGFGGQRGAAEIGVQNGAGEIEDRHERRPGLALDALRDRADDRVVRRGGARGRRRASQLRQHLPHRIRQHRPPVLLLQALQGGKTQDAVDGRKHGPLGRVHGRHGASSWICDAGNAQKLGRGRNSVNAAAACPDSWLTAVNQILAIVRQACFTRRKPKTFSLFAMGRRFRQLRSRLSSFQRRD